MPEGRKYNNYWRIFPNNHILRSIEVVSIQILLKDIVWAHPASIDLLHVFPYVLIMDCIYKTNRYRLLLMEIVRVTSIEMTFSVAFAYLEAEWEDNFSWCLDSLRSLMHGCMPSFIITNRYIACMNAIEKIFPISRYLLCKCYIRKKYSYSKQKKFRHRR